MAAKTIAVILLISLTASLAGCWNRREVNTLGITGMVGVDIEDNGIKSTFEFIKPKKADKSGGETKEKPVCFVQASGLTLFDAYRNITLKFDRKVFNPHQKVIIFGEEIARSGIAGPIDFFWRDHEPRIETPMLIAQGASAAEVMGVAAGIDDMPSKYVEDLLRGQKSNAKSVNTSVLKFLKAYSAKGKSPVVGVVRKIKKTKLVSSDEEYELAIDGAAVFSKDKLVGFLDGKETKGYNWVVEDVKSGVVVAPTPGGQGLTASEIINATSKNEVEISGDVITIRVKLAMVGSVEEESGKIDLKDPAAIALLEQSLAEVIRQEAKHTIRKVQQEYHTDIFGFGQIVHRKYPKKWKEIADNWDDIFSGAEIEIAVETRIITTMKATNPVIK